MAAFVDPRTNPTPCPSTAQCVVTDSIEEIAPLHQLCQGGRLYEVEAWIRVGRLLQLRREAVPRGRGIDTAREIALETGQYALAHLLLCNGYQLDLEPRSPLDLAMERRRWDLVDLPFEWGADPAEVDLYTLFGTYNRPLFERSHAAGVDLTQGHELAAALAYHTSNKPLFGFVNRCRETDARFQPELNMALLQHAGKGSLKGVDLCVWAGADPHTPTVDLDSAARGEASDEGEDGEPLHGWSAIAEVMMHGHTHLLKVLRPDPTRDDFEELYQTALDLPTVDALAALAPPRSIGPILRRQVFHLDARVGRTTFDVVTFRHDGSRHRQSSLLWCPASGEACLSAVRLTVPTPPCAQIPHIGYRVHLHWEVTDAPSSTAPLCLLDAPLPS